MFEVAPRYIQHYKLIENLTCDGLATNMRSWSVLNTL